MAMGRKKFNMDPKKVLGATGLDSSYRTCQWCSGTSRFQKCGGRRPTLGGETWFEYLDVDIGCPFIL